MADDEERQTTSGLPKLTIGLVNTFTRDLTTRGGPSAEEFTNESLDRIRKEDPIFWKYIETMRVSYGDDREGFGHFIEGCWFTYELLRRAGEANKMEQELG